MTCNCGSRSSAEPASSAKLPIIQSAASIQGTSPAFVSTITSCDQSGASDDALHTKDLLRLLANVNFIYGEVKSRICIAGDFLLLQSWLFCASFTMHRCKSEPSRLFDSHYSFHVLMQLGEPRVMMPISLGCRE